MIVNERLEVYERDNYIAEPVTAIEPEAEEG